MYTDLMTIRSSNIDKFQKDLAEAIRESQDAGKKVEVHYAINEFMFTALLLLKDKKSTKTAKNPIERTD